MNTVLCRPGLLVSCIQPSDRSASNHLLPSPSLGLVLTRSLPHGLSTVSLSGPWRQLGFAIRWRLATTTSRIEFVISPADQSFTFSCSPPPLTRTQLLSVTEFKPNSDKDFHLADSIHLQAHNGWAFGPTVAATVTTKPTSKCPCYFIEKRQCFWQSSPGYVSDRTVLFYRYAPCKKNQPCSLEKMPIFLLEWMP